jgi:DNA-binding FadR family transcriptional regulator
MRDRIEAIPGEPLGDGGSNGVQGDDLGIMASRSANAITSRLTRAIETGVFSDGDQLPPERQLAISLGTARSTIRKALDQLESRGLVVRRVGSGTFVNYAGPLQTPDADVADLISPLQLIEARFAVEPYMARLAAIHATGRDLDSFETVLQRIEACGSDQDQFTHWDTQFHLQLARCSRNPLLFKVYEQINAVRGARPVEPDEDCHPGARKDRRLQSPAPGDLRCPAGPRHAGRLGRHHGASRNCPPGPDRRRGRVRAA